MKRKLVIFVMMLMPILIASCGIFNPADIYSEASKYIEIKMKSNSSKEAIDSIGIVFDPVYFKLRKCDTLREKEYEFVKDGYKIWVLETADTFRIEVERIDTLGYIYKR